jgi:LEA14-like dessication related protein
MSARGKIAGLVLIVFVAGLATGCGFTPPSAKISDVKIVGIIKSKLRLDFIVQAKNVNKDRVVITKTAYTVAFFDRPMIEESFDKKIDIPGNGGSVKFALPASIAFSDLLTAGLSALEKNSLEYELRATFTVKTPVGNIPVPLVRKGSVDLSDIAGYLSDAEGLGVGEEIPFATQVIEIEFDESGQSKG